MSVRPTHSVKLPIDPHLSSICALFQRSANGLLKAAPGSGKTTRVPVALLNSEAVPKGTSVIVLEPRRLAAKFAALRIADELGEAVGKTVGYQFRYERVMSEQTRIHFYTEGTLLRKLHRDPFLSQVSVVLLDEFHERHLHTDLCLGYLAWLQRTRRPDLKIGVMSATLDTTALERYLAPCETLTLDVPSYPVSRHYFVSKKPLEDQIREVIVTERQSRDDGDFLVFLPGLSEILRAEAKLAGLSNLDVRTLHGDHSREQQSFALSASGRRRVILSTNIAESSLTIDGVTTVIDSGLHRQAQFSHWTGIPSLATKAVSRASAEQRAGRAGRTAPGRCIRLYSQGDFEGRPQFDVPEIHRADLSQTLLELMALGFENISRFPFFDPPSDSILAAAQSGLTRLGAVADGKLTELGRRMAEAPLHPRLSRLLLEAAALGIPDLGARAAAVLSEGRLESLDFSDALKNARSPTLDRSVKQLREWIGATREKAADSELALGRSLLAAFPDRVGRRRDKQSDKVRTNDLEILFSAGGSGLASYQPITLSSEFFIILDLREQRRSPQSRPETRVSCLFPVSEEMLFEYQSESIIQEEACGWDAKTEKVVARSLWRYGQIILEENTISSVPPEKAEGILLREGLKLDEKKISQFSLSDWIRLLEPIVGEGVIETALAKMKLVGEISNDWARSWFVECLRAQRSFAELRSTGWFSEMARAANLREHPPDSVPLKARSVTVRYSLEKPPWIESRLQDFFGMQKGPSILQGRVPLTLHFLAPNGRPVQVTQDLAGFWDRSYPTLRKELSKKYPRHAWPEDPRTAAPPIKISRKK